MTAANHREHDPAVEPLEPEKSLGDLLGAMTRDVGALVRQEVTLAKVEAREEVAEASKGAGLLAAAGVAAWLALLLGSLALAAWLDEAVHPAVALAIVAAIWAIVTAVLVPMGRNRLRRARPLPQTVDTLKEDMQWARQQMS